MDTVSIFARSGQENLPEGSCRVAVGVRTSDTAATSTIKGIHGFLKDAGEHVTKESAVAGKKASVVGEWQRGSYAVPVGSLICVRAKVTPPVNPGRLVVPARARQLVEFFRVREKAACIQLRLPTPAAIIGNNDRIILYGRMDRLTLEEVDNTYGLVGQIIRQEAANHDPTWARISIREPEIEARPMIRRAVVEVDGAQVTVARAVPRRKVRLALD